MSQKDDRQLHTRVRNRTAIKFRANAEFAEDEREQRIDACAWERV